MLDMQAASEVAQGSSNSIGGGVMSSEYQYGTMIADDLYREMLDRNMSVCGHRLIGQLCREGFVSRLADLFGVNTDGMVDTTASTARGQGRAGLPVAQAVSQECSAGMGSTMRGDS
jgi:hypothetical protein